MVSDSDAGSPASDEHGSTSAARIAEVREAVAAAADWFTAQFHADAGEQARSYARERGIGPDMLAAFGIGYAPAARGSLRRALARFGDERLIEAGLLISVDDKEPYDRFRDRLMIPICDPLGRVIAFGGRVLGDGEPKYLNSPETPLFDKGGTLFNLHRARGAARTSGVLVVVEGYLDVIALAQAEVDQAVAPLGTALTEAQIAALWETVETPVLCFDGDAAGQRAAMRAATRALPMLRKGRSLYFATLPPGQDPDDLVRASGVEAFAKLVRSAETLADRIWRTEVDAKPLDIPEARAGLRQRLGEHAASIRDSALRQSYRKEFERRCDALFRGGYIRTDAGRARYSPSADLSDQDKMRRGPGQAIIAAILHGLVRFPDIARNERGTVAMLPITDPELAAFRDRVLTAITAGRALPVPDFRSTLAFSFTRDDPNGSEDLRKALSTFGVSDD
ncbi:DNA primase [Sphingopyxis macrogoltabida]|uniref:Toprim domain-containing protein n=1 Tax=Sphingopyxis macrogoltabida TaxID=33050 RepID=A0AAC9FHR6_SPHMC|nr:toprim domain-containing protein [Sphingopyxis macrogoltabida]ALJ16637.1 DNA primase [Sphingopyxis macrogoltabida]AMU92863.1 hypothetical protein ATM17_31910 [Sphingopyxis macrogoltabida]